MPFKSDAQRRFMYAAALGKLKDKKNEKISEEDAKKFISHSHNEGADLPEKVKK